MSRSRAVGSYGRTYRPAHTGDPLASAQASAVVGVCYDCPLPWNVRTPDMISIEGCQVRSHIVKI